MNFKLDLPLETSDFKLNYTNDFALIGSCFTEHIGHQLMHNKFNVLLNPFGILFHPIAIFNALNKIVKQELFSENDLFFHHELWHSFEHHSDFSNTDKNMCLNNINDSILQAHEFIKKTKYLFITLGTSIVYEFNENHKIVSNCHKVEANKFNKRYLEETEIHLMFNLFYENILKLNQDIKILFTISPVRHWRDGLIENNRSKALLINCVHQWTSQYSQISYFPAYELVIDDLRDYRFFEKDLCHPNALAIEYVWNYFKRMYFDDITLAYIQDIEKYNNLLNHKPKFEQTTAYKILQEKIKAKESEIKQKYF
jgi:hypothetical protein